ACDAVRQLLARAIDEGRRMINDLRPMILDEEGLVASIDFLIADSFQKSGLNVRFSHAISFMRISPLLEQALFRIVQEALNNVRRHSHATEAQVRLWDADGWIYLEISDQGTGFDLTQVPADRFGLRGIRERARLFGGRSQIEARPG